MATELRYAVRLLVRSPTFTITALASLALGIGATTTTFALARGVLWNPLPYRDPERLVVVWETSATHGGVSATDPATFAYAPLALLAIALAACAIPAWRAAKLDPARVLRAE